MIKEWLREREPGVSMDVSAYKSLLQKARSSMKMVEQLHEKAVRRAHDILKIRIRYSYEPILSGAHREEQAELRIYLSTDVSTQVCILLPTTTPVETTLIFRLRSGAITADCIMNLDAYARYRNEDGTMCVNQAGYSNSLLSSVLSGQLFETSLTVRNSHEKHSKGEVRLQVLSAATERGRRFDENAPLAAVLSRMQRDNDAVLEYARRNQDFYNQYRPRVKSIERITVYLQQTRVGCVPGALFDVFRLHKPDEEYYLNSLHIAVQRRFGASLKVDLETRWLRDCEPRLQTACAMDMLCVFVTACPYITDEVDNNDEKRGRWNAKLVELIESFDDVFSRNAGDCEDFARAILRLYYEILLGKEYFQSKVMRAVAAIFERFIVFSLLCGVSTASIRDASSGDSQLNGHEAAIALPKAVFYEALRRRQPHHSVLATASAAELSAGADDCIYVLEGTGMLRPEPSKSTSVAELIRNSVSSAQQQRSSAPEEDLADASVLMHYDPRAPNNFYKLMVTLITPYFFLKWGHGFVEFLLVYQKSQNCTERGVWFTELLNLHSDRRVGCEAAPMISEYVFGAFEHVSKDDYPLHSLHSAPLTDEMCDLAARSTYIQPGAAIDDDHVEIPDTHSYSFFININRMNQWRAASIVSLAKKAGLSVRTTAQPISVSPERLLSGVYQCKFF